MVLRRLEKERALKKHAHSFEKKKIYVKYYILKYSGKNNQLKIFFIVIDLIGQIRQYVYKYKFICQCVDKFARCKLFCVYKS